MDLQSSWKELVDAAYIYEAPENMTIKELSSSTSMAEVQQWLEILSSKQLETQATLEGIQDKWDLWTKATAGEEQKKPGVNANYGINKLRSQLKMRVNLQAKLHAALKDKIVKHDVSSSTTSLTPKPGVEDAASDGPFGVKAVVDDVTTSASASTEAQVRSVCIVYIIDASYLRTPSPTPPPATPSQIPASTKSGKPNGKAEVPPRHCCVCNATLNLWAHHECATCGKGVCYKPGDDNLNACCKETLHTNEAGGSMTLKQCTSCASKLAVVDGATSLMSDARARRVKVSVALEKAAEDVCKVSKVSASVRVSKTPASDQVFLWRTTNEQTGLSAENVVRMQPLFKKLSSVAESLLSSDHWPPEHAVLVWAGNNMRAACSDLLFSINDDDGPALEATVRRLMEWIDRPPDGSEDEQHRLCDLTAESLRGRMLDLLASFAKSIGPDAGPEVK
jgi:hypothetical protein